MLIFFCYAVCASFASIRKNGRSRTLKNEVSRISEEGNVTGNGSPPSLPPKTRIKKCTLDCEARVLAVLGPETRQHQKSQAVVPFNSDNIQPPLRKVQLTESQSVAHPQLFFCQGFANHADSSSAVQNPGISGVLSIQRGLQQMRIPETSVHHVNETTQCTNRPMPAKSDLANTRDSRIPSSTAQTARANSKNVVPPPLPPRNRHSSSQSESKPKNPNLDPSSSVRADRNSHRPQDLNASSSLHPDSISAFGSRLAPYRMPGRAYSDLTAADISRVAQTYRTNAVSEQPQQTFSAVQRPTHLSRQLSEQCARRALVDHSLPEIDEQLPPYSLEAPVLSTNPNQIHSVLSNRPGESNLLAAQPDKLAMVQKWLVQLDYTNDERVYPHPVSHENTQHENSTQLDATSSTNADHSEQNHFKEPNNPTSPSSGSHTPSMNQQPPPNPKQLLRSQSTHCTNRPQLPIPQNAAIENPKPGSGIPSSYQYGNYDNMRPNSGIITGHAVRSRNRHASAPDPRNRHSFPVSNQFNGQEIKKLSALDQAENFYKVTQDKSDEISIEKSTEKSNIFSKILNSTTTMVETIRAFFSRSPSAVEDYVTTDIVSIKINKHPKDPTQATVDPSKDDNPVYETLRSSAFNPSDRHKNQRSESLAAVIGSQSRANQSNSASTHAIAQSVPKSANIPHIDNSDHRKHGAKMAVRYPNNFYASNNTNQQFNDPTMSGFIPTDQVQSANPMQLHAQEVFGPGNDSIGAINRYRFLQARSHSSGAIETKSRHPSMQYQTKHLDTVQENPSDHMYFQNTVANQRPHSSRYLHNQANLPANVPNREKTSKESFTPINHKFASRIPILSQQISQHPDPQPGSHRIRVNPQEKPPLNIPSGKPPKKPASTAGNSRHHPLIASRPNFDGSLDDLPVMEARFLIKGCRSDLPQDDSSVRLLSANGHHIHPGANPTNYAVQSAAPLISAARNNASLIQYNQQHSTNMQEYYEQKNQQIREAHNPKVRNNAVAEVNRELLRNLPGYIPKSARSNNNRQNTNLSTTATQNIPFLPPQAETTELSKNVYDYEHQLLPSNTCTLLCRQPLTSTNTDQDQRRQRESPNAAELLNASS